MDREARLPYLVDMTHDEALAVQNEIRSTICRRCNDTGTAYTVFYGENRRCSAACIERAAQIRARCSEAQQVLDDARAAKSAARRARAAARRAAAEEDNR